MQAEVSATFPRSKERPVHERLVVVKRVVGFAVGTPFAAWRYIARDVEIHRSETVADWPLNGFPENPAEDRDLQTAADGIGCAHRRRYRVRIERPRVSAEQLMGVIMADPNVASPTDIARFHKTRGALGELAVGDEFLIRLPGPWNGPVRVIERTPLLFRFATLRGHMEAGEIEFSGRNAGEAIEFQIESWARSGDRLFDALYRLRLSMEVQLHMWVDFLERVAQVAGGVPARGIELVAERCYDHGM